MILEQLHASAYEIKGGSTGLVFAMRIVQLAWPIDAQADEEVMGLEKAAPILVETRAVGLQRVVDLASASVLGLQFDDLFEIIQAQQGGLAPLPSKGHFEGLLGGNVLANVGFKHLW